MKTPNLTPQRLPSLLRRKLLLGLPGGLALASPLALVSCGGSSDDGGGGFDPAIDEIVARLPALKRSAQAVKVVLPVGLGVDPATTHFVTGNNVSQVMADGSAGAVLIDGAPQMGYLFDANGRLLLMSAIEPGVRTTIDARGSAEALLLAVCEGGLLEPAIRIALRRALADARLDAVVEPVRQAVEAAQRRQGIDPADSELMDALRGAVRLLCGASGDGASPKSVTVSPEGTESGITVQPTEDFNTVVLQNQFRRRTHVWIARTGSYDSEGNYSALPAPAPAPALADFALDATTALSFDNLVKSAGDYVTQFYSDIGFLGAYESGSAVWTPVKSAPVQLLFEPDGAQGVEYSARVVGIAAVDNGVLSEAENAAYEQILWDTLIEDIAKPFIQTLILPMISERVPGLAEPEFQKVSWQLVLNGIADLTNLAVGGSFFPATVDALKKGEFKAAVSGFLTEFFSSNTFQGLYEAGMSAWVKSSGVDWTLRDGKGTLIGVNLLDRETLAARNVAALRGALDKLARIIQLIKVGTLIGDYAAIGHDLLGSARLTEFTLTISKAQVSLTPKPFEVAATSGLFAITAKVEGLEASVPASSVFVEWKCSGKYGTLYQVGGSGSDSFTSPLTAPSHNYAPSGVEDDPADPETIAVVAFYRNPTTNKRVEMGKASVSVVFKREFSLGLSPAGCDLPTETDMPLQAFVREKLPAGSTVEWEWTHGGAGTLTAGAPDANPGDSSATLATGAGEGSATVSVRATVRVPASDPKGARTIQTQVVSATYRIKKGTREITFDASGGVFSYADGTASYTAFIVPRLPKATGYVAVLSGYAYPNCNRTVRWNSEIPDRGDCNFPVTYHPIAARALAPCWAVWIGFAGLPIEGKCTVTITLPA